MYGLEIAKCQKSENEGAAETRKLEGKWRKAVEWEFDREKFQVANGDGKGGKLEREREKPLGSKQTKTVTG